MTVFTFRINYFFSALAASSYHLTNAILHSVTCFLAFKLYALIVKECFSIKCELPQKSKSDKITKHAAHSTLSSVNAVDQHMFIAHIASLLFIVHPVHTEAVSWCCFYWNCSNDWPESTKLKNWNNCVCSPYYCITNRSTCFTSCIYSLLYEWTVSCIECFCKFHTFFPVWYHFVIMGKW